MTGAAFGAAVSGLRPVIEIMFGDFLALSMDQLVNQAASTSTSRTSRRASRSWSARPSAPAGASARSTRRRRPRGSQACRGSRSSRRRSPADAKALLKAAIRDDNPVLFLEHKRLYSLKQERRDGDRGAGADRPRAGRARGRRRHARIGDEGRPRLPRGRRAAERAGIDAEVIDLRTLRPLDHDDGARLARQDQPAARRRRGAAHRRLGRRGPRVRRRAGPPRHRRRLASPPPRPDPLQPAARGRLPPGADASPTSVRARAGVGVA